MTDLILQMATAFINQGDPDGEWVADSVELIDGDYYIAYHWPSNEQSGKSVWRVTPLELLAFVWSRK